ncbi:hypothetical protein LUZ60_000044 [Juncus effusus]|nr:hypothetical protein LUZ60_000044 [Juncus effusus]
MGSLPAVESDLPIRRLEISDYHKGFVELLGQLTVCPPITESEFEARFADIAATGDDHQIFVIQSPSSSLIIATGTLFIERKFIRGCSKAGHIEEIVVDKAARGLRLGQRMVEHLVDKAKEMGCYKVVLACETELRGFYEKCGFVEKDTQMTVYF